MACCVGDDWEGIAAIAEEHESWLRRFLTLQHGVPSHDTFGRVLSLVDPAVVTLRMVDWIKTFRESCGEEIIAIDGKALRRSGSQKKGLKMLHTVGAWATENGLILGQQVVNDKSNEITAIPQLIELHDQQRRGRLPEAHCRTNRRERSPLRARGEG